MKQTPTQFRKQLKIILDYVDMLEARSVKSYGRLYPEAELPKPTSPKAKTTLPVGDLPRTNAKGWILHKDAAGIQAYVGPNGEIEEAQ